MINITLKKIFENQFVRFLAVGGLNVAFSYSVYSFLIFIGLHYSLAALFGTILSVLFNFKTTGLLVFKISDNSLLIKFFAVYGIIYLLNLACLYILIDLFGLSPYLAGGILILPLAIVSFLLNKKFVFKQTRASCL